MILRQLVLNPFGGVAHQEVEFEDGLNVVLGPNEAGKSTLVNALKMTLFFPPQSGKRFDQQISRFLPLAGGDTIRVKLIFAIEPDLKTYNLSKSWGGRREAQLILPTGGLLAEPLAVQEKLRELLVLGECTYNSVLFAYQSSLGTTLENLKNNQEARHDLATLLRRAIFETDGISVDLLEQKINERHYDYYSRWDADLNCPEGNRGIERPWKKEIGVILSAYYHQEELRQCMERVRNHEWALDALNTQIRTVTEEVNALRTYVDTHKEPVKDAKKRQGIEAQLELRAKEEGELIELTQRWPKLEKEIKDAEKQLEILEKNQTVITSEVKKAKAYEEGRLKLDKFIRAEKKKGILEKNREKLAELIAINEADFRRLEELHGHLKELKASLSAGSLSLHFVTARPMELQIAKNLEGKESCTLAAGQALEVSASGYCELQHVDWMLTVRSGEINFATLKTEYGSTQIEYQSLLSQLRMPDFDAAKSAHSSYNEQVRTVDSLEKELKDILEGESFEDLEKVVRTMPKSPPPRGSAEVGEELGRVKTTIEQKQQEIEEKRTELEKLENTYISKDNLNRLLKDRARDRGDMEKKLAELKPLPEGVIDTEGYVAEFEQKEDNLREQREKLEELRIQRAGLEAQAPTETGEELEPQIQEAQSRFEQALRDGEAVAEILRVFDTIKADMDRDTLVPWLQDLQELVAPITTGQYRTIVLGEEHLGKAVRHDGLHIPPELLSGGTKPSLGLACRLSMARHFLKGLRGFMVLDDPMVDMDAARQQAAALVIQEFAHDKQIIVLTCHEGHARLLGGHLIRLN
jgi:exonuclease SbcC